MNGFAGRRFEWIAPEQQSPLGGGELAFVIDSDAGMGMPPFIRKSEFSELPIAQWVVVTDNLLTHWTPSSPRHVRHAHNTQLSEMSQAVPRSR